MLPAPLALHVAKRLVALSRAMESPEEKAEREAREKRKARLIARANWELAEKRFARWMPKETQA